MPEDAAPSLIRLFTPPDGMCGHFGWICGYSADVGFMESAVERFSCRARNQRMQAGRVYLALMLDPGNPQLPPHACPGVRHLGRRRELERESRFQLMHAKVALLLFRSENGETYTLRLIVSTGNWTRQTLMESLDLYWRVDLPLADIRNHPQEHADCRAAWDFINFIHELYEPLFPATLIAGLSFSESAEAAALFRDRLLKLAQARPSKKCLPRFMDNRKRPFADQLEKRITALDDEHGGSRRRNYLAMGSGFFESQPGNGTPSVLVKIVERLQEAGVLTRQPETDIIVEPAACQGVALASAAIQRRGWTIRPAAPPLKLFRGSYRKLHAKFLFSACYTKRSDLCTSPWVYLGSGNLTRQGFTTRLPGGNLEAGVLFKPDTLFWCEHKEQPENWVCNLLPISWEAAPIKKPEELKSGDGMEDRPPVFFAAPVSLLRWAKRDAKTLLLAPEASEPYTVYSVDGQPCPMLRSGIFVWEGAAKPVEVEIRWRDMRARVPVMDEYGRIGAGEAQAVHSLSEAWTLLAEFSAYPEIDEEPTSPDPVPPDNPDGGAFRRGKDSPASSYPVRSMMELLERIAEKQTGLCEADWALWCSRLEMTFVQAADCPEAAAFREWKINPLTPLRETCFVPTFAEEGECRQRYLKVLRKAGQAWRVNGKKCMRLGSMNSEGGK